MPTYEYECQKCGHRFDKLQRMSEEHLKKCPLCKGPLKRLIGAGAGLIFKGSGFFITDYKRKAPKENKSSSSGKESSSKSEK